MHARTHQRAGEEAGCQAPPSTALCLIPLRWTLSLILELASFLARLAVSKFQRSPVCPLLPRACGYTCLYFFFTSGLGIPAQVLMLAKPGLFLTEPSSQEGFLELCRALSNHTCDTGKHRVSTEAGDGLQWPLGALTTAPGRPGQRTAVS